MSSLKIALPNKGRLCDGTITFLEKCAFSVRRDNVRQYQTEMSGIGNGIEVVFQRARDIPKLLREGGADLGITGFDIYWEMGGEESSGCWSVFPDQKEDALQNVQALPYGNCSLVIAVPDHWVDIVTISDLAELAISRKKENKILRVDVTEFKHLTQQFLFVKGISYFEIAEVYGAAESAPRMGSADFVADLKSSGVTLTENRLKEIAGGEIMKSGACLIASAENFRKERPHSEKLETARQLIERIEAHLSAKKYWLITANIKVPNSSNVERQELQLRDELTNELDEQEIRLLGQQGPTIAKVLPLSQDHGDFNFFSVSIQVESQDLERVIVILRSKTGRDILVSPLSFVYDNESKAYKLLLQKLGKMTENSV